MYSTQVLHICCEHIPKWPLSLRTVVWAALDNSLYVLCNNYDIVIGHCYLNCLEFRANLYNDWLASFGGTWHVELTPCEHYWVREMVNMFLFFNFDETRYLNEDICFNWDFTSLHPMLSYTFLHVLLQFGILYVPISIQCDNRCLILLGRFFIYPIFFCIFNYAIFIPKSCANKDIYIYIYTSHFCVSVIIYPFPNLTLNLVNLDLVNEAPDGDMHFGIQPMGQQPIMTPGVDTPGWH